MERSGQPRSLGTDLVMLAEVLELVLEGLQVAKLAVVQEMQQHEELCDVVLQRRPRQQHSLLGPQILENLSNETMYGFRSTAISLDSESGISADCRHHSENAVLWAHRQMCTTLHIASFELTFEFDGSKAGSRLVILTAIDSVQHEVRAMSCRRSLRSCVHNIQSRSGIESGLLSERLTVKRREFLFLRRCPSSTTSVSI